jgi:hypothetical protein
MVAVLTRRVRINNAKEGAYAPSFVMHRQSLFTQSRFVTGRLFFFDHFDFKLDIDIVADDQ